MELKQCIRIEHGSEGLGMWRSNQSDDMYYNSKFSKMYERHGRQMPIPRLDEGIGTKFRSGTHHCAYRSISQMQKWITKRELKNVIKEGFKIYLIEGTKTYIIEGENQVIFNPKKIKTKKDITNLFII